MEYLVFPFGKYKGVVLNELPSTYIVLALEQFDLPQELRMELGGVLLGRFLVFSSIKDHLLEKGDAYIDFLDEHISKYEIDGE